MTADKRDVQERHVRLNEGNKSCAAGHFTAFLCSFFGSRDLQSSHRKLQLHTNQDVRVFIHRIHRTVILFETLTWSKEKRKRGFLSFYVYVNISEQLSPTPDATHLNLRCPTSPT
jgi:hypothetical protein